MKSTDDRDRPSFVRKKPPDVQLTSCQPRPESPDACVSPSMDYLINASDPLDQLDSLDQLNPLLSNQPTFHFELPSECTSPAELAQEPEVNAESNMNSGAASSQGQSPPPPFDETEQQSQFARFRQEVNRRMHSLLRTQLLPSQPTSPAPDSYSITYAWPAYTAAVAAPIAVNFLSKSNVIPANHTYRSSLHPDAAIQPLGRYSPKGRLSAPVSGCATPHSDKQSMANSLPLPQFTYDLANASQIKCDYDHMDIYKTPAWPLWNIESTCQAQNRNNSTNTLAPPVSGSSVHRSSASSRFQSADLSVSIKSSIDHCYFGFQVLFNLLKLSLIVLLLLSCARLSTLFFSIPDRIRLYVPTPVTGQRALKLRICFQLMFSFALLVQIIQLYGVMYERYCLSGIFGSIQLIILILMAIDARMANETSLEYVWLVALALSIVYVILLRKLKHRRRRKQQKRAAAETTGSLTSTPYHEWCAQETKRIREQMRTAGQLNALGGVVGSEPIGVTTGPVIMDQWYQCPNQEQMYVSLPQDHSMVERFDRPFGGYTKGRISVTPEVDDSNYCNLHFVNDEVDQDQLNTEALSRQLFEHLDNAKVLQSAHQQYSLPESEHVKMAEVKRSHSEDYLVGGETRYQQQPHTGQCSLDTRHKPPMDTRLSISNDQLTCKFGRAHLEQLDARGLLHHLDRTRIGRITGQHTLRKSSTSPLV